MPMFYWGLAALFVIVLFLMGWSRFMDRVSDPPGPMREWVAHSPSGSVSLGVCAYSDALERAARLGKVSHVDHQHGFIFYDTHLGQFSGGGLGSQDSGR